MKAKTYGKKNPHPKSQKGPLVWVKDEHGLKTKYYKQTGDLVLLRREPKQIQITGTHKKVIERVISFVEGEKANKASTLRREVWIPHKHLRGIERAFIHSEIGSNKNAKPPKHEEIRTRKTIIQALNLHNPFLQHHTKTTIQTTKTNENGTSTKTTAKEVTPQDYKRMRGEK